MPLKFLLHVSIAIRATLPLRASGSNKAYKIGVIYMRLI